MRLRNLTKESKVEEIMTCLEQRHPLYFMNPNLKKEQIKNLVQKIQFRMKGEAKVPLKTKADLNNFVKSSNPAPASFKSGGSLPSLDAGKENKSKAVVKF